MGALLIKTILICLCICLPSGKTLAQGFNENWKEDLARERKEFMECGKDITCKSYVGKSFQTVYGIDDFYLEDEERFMYFDEILSALETNALWELVGPAFEQINLDKAQVQANQQKATLATYISEDGLGHIALVLPGQLVPSGSWGMNVPNTASFFTASPDKSYVGKSMSYAFTTSMIKRVKLYTRKE
jgi:hypothetical protein